MSDSTSDSTNGPGDTSTSDSTDGVGDTTFNNYGNRELFPLAPTEPFPDPTLTASVKFIGIAGAAVILCLVWYIIALCQGRRQIGHKYRCSVCGGKLSSNGDDVSDQTGLIAHSEKKDCSKSRRVALCLCCCPVKRSNA